MDVPGKGAYRGGENLRHMHVAFHFCKKDVQGADTGRRSYTCKLFRNVVGVSQDVLPIKISRPSLALSLWATLISLRVTPPTTKATMRFPCNMCVETLSSDIANGKGKQGKTTPFGINLMRSQLLQWGCPGANSKHVCLDQSFECCVFTWFTGLNLVCAADASLR